MAVDEDTSGQPSFERRAPAGESGAVPVAATTLPATPPQRPGRPASFWVALGGVGALLVVAIVLPLTLREHHTAEPAAAARARGFVGKQAVFAQSDTAVTDTAGVRRDSLALLAGRLPAAHLSGDARAALVHPPAATGSPVLAAALSLSDPELPACVSSVTDGDTLFGIDRISYAGQPSLLVVTADTESATHAFAYVLGPGCALPGTGIRTVVTVPLTGTS